MRRSWNATYTPHRVGFFRVELKIALRKLQGRRAGQPQVRPTLYKLDHRFERVQRQPIVPIVRHVRHEDIDLRKNAARGYGIFAKKKGVECRITHGIVHDRLEQLAALYRFVQLVPSAWVSIDEDRVREKAAGLPR